MSKFGQMISYVSSPLPSEVRDEFAMLQDRAPIMANELVNEIVLHELGELPETLFDTWDPNPIASASIGQVHRAITKEGEAIALKIQFPNVAESLTADLANLRLLAKGFRFAYPSMDTDSIVNEIADRIVEELDYLLEAKNQTQFYEFYLGHPYISIPKIIPQYSTSKVLASELAAGMPFRDFLKSDQAEKNLAAETIFRFVFRSLYQIKSFNGDPHPGNYLFGGNGKVTFLDFGLTKHFNQGDITQFEQMIQAMVISHSPVKFSQAIRDAGLLAPDCSLNADEIYSHFIPFYDSVYEDKPFTFSESYTSQLFAHMFSQKTPISKYLQVSQSFVIIQRINLGLYSILSALNATQNFRGIAEELWPFVDSVPTTDMGHAEQRWLETRHFE